MGDRSMFRKSAIVVSIAAVTAAVVIGVVTASPADRVGEKLQDVTLLAADGKPVQLLDFHKEKVLVIAYTGVGCPIAERYAPRLEKIADKFGRKEVVFVGINANPNDTLERIVESAKALEITFPILKDPEQALTRQLDARTTTEAFVVDSDRVIRYRGMIDDQYAIGAQRKNPKNRYLEDAINDVLKGKSPLVTRTVAPGCLITRAAPASVPTDLTFASPIAGIVQNNCQRCHRDGHIAPFPLLTYEDVRGWSAMIYSVLTEGRMPPWNAHPRHAGLFANERKMADADRDAILKWIDAGMPQGDVAAAPPEREWPEGWTIGEPDAVFTMRSSFNVPVDGTVEYQHFRIPTTFKEDKWITAMEAQAGAKEVVHHILVFIVPKDGEVDQQRIGLDDGMLCATVPGDTPSVYPEGYGKKLPAGATLVMQVHYTTSGKKMKDKSSIGMIFSKSPVAREVRTRGVYSFDLNIPPGAADHEVRASYTFDKDCDVLSFFPHMHFRGKSWQFIAHYADGRAETVLEVPRYDFNWQESYILKSPMFIPKGTKIECIAHYDNSAANFANPDPAAAVRWGEQTWEEMMIGYMDYVYR